MTVDTCGPITAVYNCPLGQDLSTFLTVPCQINQGLLRKTTRIETISDHARFQHKFFTGREKTEKGCF